MRRIRKHLTFANVASAIALFVALGGGTAAALSGHDTVQSDDLGPGAQVKAPDVADNAVNGADVKNGTLHQADLGVRVRSARQVDDGSPAAVCAKGPDFEECTTASFNVPRPQRLLLVGSGEWYGPMTSNRNSGECEFAVGNRTTLGNRKFGARGVESWPGNIAMNSVTGVLPKGGYEIFFECREESGQIAVKNTELSVVALGDG